MSEELKQHHPPGYNPSTGIYVSSQIFTGDWSDELAALDYTPREKAVAENSIVAFDADKGIVTNYLYNAFRSEDGKSTTTELKDFWQEVDPANFSYTESYYNSPKLRAILDWFQVDKTRVRIFQQQPGHMMEMHTDFDELRGTEHGEVLRIFVQLNDMPGGAWFRCKTEDSEVSINLQKGQFLIFHPDHTAHGTENVTEIPRNTFMLVVKRNEWIDSLVGQSHMEFINVDEMAADKAVAA